MRHLILILGDQLNLDNPALEGFDASQDHILMWNVWAKPATCGATRRELYCFYRPCGIFMNAL